MVSYYDFDRQIVRNGCAQYGGRSDPRNPADVCESRVPNTDAPWWDGLR